MTDKELWSFTDGERPNTVTVYERTPGGMLYARAWDVTLRRGKRVGDWRRVSLGHRDKARAKRYAREQVAKLENGQALEAKVKLSEVFKLYEQYRTPKKSEAHQDADRRRIEMWLRFLGNIDPHGLTRQQWEAFIDARSSGAIDPRGNPVPQKKRKEVRTRGVEIDLVWLRAVYTWATTWSMGHERYLMRHNPTLGFEIPREKNPLRALASQDRFEALRAVSDQHTFEARWTGKRTKVRSYMSELLDIVNGTGRRIESVCELRYEDLRLNEGKHGKIRWPADVDKTGREWLSPISATVRAAIDRVLKERPGIGRVPLFPAPGDPREPMSRHLAGDWLTAVEKMAGLEPLPRRQWHAFRGKWATERKHLPEKDVAAVGGWKSTLTLKLYQQPDEASMLSVVESGRELREVKQG